ncbi:hypothetical protein JYU34_018583 [Plutella xylostella]|uniref:G-protein coupled receptors family 1 profile domain-containing protein n=1 Tax=Plutella xylostella TaxID=51655 RepID=A0ABQ7PZB6_PLUXY|nr:hypothetical protein JYU34_018583 [Plutella xylostella]
MSLIFGTTVDSIVASDVMCLFQIGMIVCPTMVSIFSVGFIAIDRYIYIIHGLYYQRWINTTRVRIGILIIWLVAISIASLPAMGWTGLTFTNYRCWYIAVFPPALLVVVSIISLLVIIMVCVLYFLILHRAVKAVDDIRAFRETNHKIAYINKAFDDECKKYDEISETTVTITLSTNTLSGESCSEIEMHEIDNMESMTSMNDQPPGNHEPQWYRLIRKKMVKMRHYYRKARAVNSQPSKFKAVKTVIFVTACFVCTWAPYYVSIIVYVNCNILINGYVCIPIETLTLGPLYFLGVCNSLCDPVIYAWWHTGFKKSVKKIYWKYVWKIRIFRLHHGLFIR